MPEILSCSSDWLIAQNAIEASLYSLTVFLSISSADAAEFPSGGSSGGEGQRRQERTKS